MNRLSFLLNSSLVLVLISCSWAGAVSSAPDSPVRIAQGPGHTVLVSEYRRQAIVFVDTDTLQERRKIKVEGKPLGVAWSNGLVYVGNESTGRVYVYGPDNTIILTIGDTGSMVPNDLAVDQERGRIYVADCREKVVKVFMTTGEYIYNIGESSLTNPTAVSYDPVRHELLVSDFGDPGVGIPPSIQIYDGDGGQVATVSGIHKTGMFSSTATFVRPQGVAAGMDGKIYLVDSFLGQLLVLDRENGALLASFDSSVSGEKLLLPLDLLLLPAKGEILVTNNRAGRISRFSLPEVMP